MTQQLVISRLGFAGIHVFDEPSHDIIVSLDRAFWHSRQLVGAECSASSVPAASER